jgi:hypothetical protein
MAAAPVPSIKTIAGMFPTLDRAAVKAIREALESATDSTRMVHTALRRVDEIIGGHGIESFKDTDGDYVTYVNMGDPYRPTAMYDERTGLTRVGCWGDYVESWEGRGRRFP